MGKNFVNCEAYYKTYLLLLLSREVVNVGTK